MNIDLSILQGLSKKERKQLEVGVKIALSKGYDVEFDNSDIVLRLYHEGFLTKEKQKTN